MRLLTWAQVRFVVERFETLGVRWKSENGTLDEPTTALVVGVNKIILGREDSAGVLQVVRSNDTDLGWIVDPTGTGAHLPDGRAAWIAEVEGAILRAAVEHGSGSSLVRGDLADWCGRPALRQFTPTTWPDLKAARAALGDPALRPYARLLRASGGATGSGPVAVDNGSGPDSWAKLDWWWRGQQVSLFTLDALGTILPLGGSGLLRVHIDTVADHLARWLRENDPSMAGPERGLRQPVPVCSGPGLIGVFGKDGGRMAAQDDDHDATDQLRYGAPLGELRTAVQAVGVPVVAKASGLGARTLQRYLDGTRTPDRETVARVASAVAELVDTARAGQCPGPGCTITLRPKQHYCSSSCRNAAWRAAQVAGAAS